MKWPEKKDEKGLNSASTENPLSEKAIVVSDYLTEDRIFFFGKKTTKSQIIVELVKSLNYPKGQLALDAIFDREKAGATVIGSGVSVPHARLVDIADIMPALGIYPAGMKEISTEEPIRFFLLFLGPANYMKRNLDFLASISALFLTEGFGNSLLQSTTPQTVLKKIQEVEKRSI